MAAFRELARHKLDAIRQGGVIRTLDTAERQALDLLAQRRQALERLMERRAAAQAVKDREAAERHAKSAAPEEALKPIADLRQQVEAQVRASPEWAAQRARIENAPAIADEAEKKPAQADVYLWRKKFGPAEDQSGPLVRFFDRRVARLVGYDKARANYALLNEIPQRLREHAGRMKAEIANAREQLKAMEREALVKTASGHSPHAPVPLRRTLTKLNANGRRGQDALAALDRAYDASVLQGKGPYQDAIELLATADAQESLQALYREAMATPAPEDDAIVRRIEATDGAVRRAEREMDGIRARLRDLAQRRATIERERDVFRQHGYDQPYGRFDNGSTIGKVLGGILGGVIGSAVLRDTLNGGYNRQPGPWDSDFGGGFPFPQNAGGDWTGGARGSGDSFDTGGPF